jgi:hypothetical protein
MSLAHSHGLKPRFILKVFHGTAEAVPFPSPSGITRILVKRLDLH